MVYCFQLKGVLEILKAGRSTLAPILNTCQRHEHLLIIPQNNMPIHLCIQHPLFVHTLLITMIRANDS